MAKDKALSINTGRLTLYPKYAGSLSNKGFNVERCFICVFHSSICISWEMLYACAGRVTISIQVSLQ
jgi:hypothetical protein